MKRGFTIVELLIVIVVIAILASITIVAYNGIQDRAKYTSAHSAMSTIRDALLAYQAKTGAFPVTGTTASVGWRYSCAYQPDNAGFIPGLTDIITTVPQAPCNAGTNNSDTFLYGSDGVGYKLIYIRASVSDTYRTFIPTAMRDTRWSSSQTTWGYWTDDWASI
ncbi:hypothetical protein CL689_05610 [Candidatus Saccharibacteria bacterium]|nr:hypothetical protein [Candidatus Saccharibacteria bacterium]MBJ58313.1 hypothetical protein [Candidatus Saccharibacteria bacterium]MBQ69520.1 hypothetical protein [Candidatus Saccharibacteria bacterium]|tara:strand:- start:1156 stop:1647 length:492 start_codon:yes stop_codon:yes gene_type:complete